MGVRKLLRFLELALPVVPPANGRGSAALMMRQGTISFQTGGELARFLELIFAAALRVSSPTTRTISQFGLTILQRQGQNLGPKADRLPVDSFLSGIRHCPTAHSYSLIDFAARTVSHLWFREAIRSRFKVGVSLRGSRRASLLATRQDYLDEEQKTMQAKRFWSFDRSQLATPLSAATTTLFNLI